MALDINQGIGNGVTPNRTEVPGIQDPSATTTL